MSIKRAGNCWQDCVNHLHSLHDNSVKLVHGLPEGRNGEAGKVGRYPHAWLEHKGLCWEPAIETWIAKFLFYGMGNIEYAVVYDTLQVYEKMHEYETYGPWDQTLLDRDNEISLEWD